MEQKEIINFVLGRMSAIENKTQTAYDAIQEAQTSLNDARLRLEELDSQRAQVFIVCNALLGEKVKTEMQNRVIDQIAAANRGMSYDNRAFRETMDKINAE
jgi:hypothetical protein